METTLTDNKMQDSVKSSSTLEAMKKSVRKMVDTPLAEQISNKAEEIKEETIYAYDSSLELIRKNPITSLAIATGVGVVLGMIFKSRR